MRSGYAAIINQIQEEQEQQEEVVQAVSQDIAKEQVDTTSTEDYLSDVITMRQSKMQEQIREVEEIKDNNSSKERPKSQQREGSIITMLFGYISSIIINIIWVVHFAKGGYFSMTPEYNGRFLNEGSRLLNITGSLFLSLVVMAAISGITGLLFSILIHKFKVSKKHMIVYAIMLALLFYIDIMYIGLNCQNVYH